MWWSYWANKNTGHPFKFEFQISRCQINIQIEFMILSMTVSQILHETWDKQYLGYTYTKCLYTTHLKFDLTGHPAFYLQPHNVLFIVSLLELGKFLPTHTCAGTCTPNFQLAHFFVFIHKVISEFISIIFSSQVLPFHSSKTYAVCCLSRWVM